MPEADVWHRTAIGCPITQAAVRRTMRIVCLTQWFWPEPESSRGLPLAQWLQKRGHEVTVLTGFPNYPTGHLSPGYRIRPWQWETVEGVRVLRVPLYPSHDRSTLRRSLNYLSFAAAASLIGMPMLGNVDVVYAMATPPTVGLPPLLNRLFRGVPYLFNVTDIWPEAVIDSGMVCGRTWNRLIEAWLNALCRVVYGRATFITAISDGYKDILVQRGVPVERVHAVHNWVDEARIRPVERDPLLGRQLGFEGRFNVLYAGNFGPFQGVETILRAAARVAAVSEIQVVLAGTGQLEDELRRLHAELSLKNVRFLGRIDPHEMPGLYALADASLIHLRDLPFLRATVPSKTQVSLASGRPIIIAAEGESAAMVRAAGAGIACPPENEKALAEAILALYRVPVVEREAMGRRGRDYYVSQMSLDVGARKIERLFELSLA